jgi:hypothetical protein
MALGLACQPHLPHFRHYEIALYPQSLLSLGLHQVHLCFVGKELESVVSVATGIRLIGLFDRFIAPQYPIFSTSSYPSARSSPTYLLAAIYCIVLPFIQFDDILPTELAYEQPPYSALLQIALRVLAFEIYNPSLPVIQALLLILVRPLTNPLVSESSLKWTVQGILVTSAQTLGLHTDPKTWSIAKWQIAQRRRISFLIYATDTWIACSLGRPPLLNGENWLVTSLSQDDELQTGLDAIMWKRLVQHAELTGVLRNVLSRLQ